MAHLLVSFIDRQFIHNSPPIPTASFKGKTIIVTGASSGLGLEACRWLINLEASQIILACRNVEKGKTAVANLQESNPSSSSILQVWELDLSSYASVQAFCDRARTELPRLDAVLPNAGLGKRTFEMTEDNEETITTNVVSMTLLSFLLYPKLRETARKYDTQTYLTVTASELYEVAKFKELSAPKGQLFAALADESRSDMGDRYNVSKLLGMFVVRQLADMTPLASNGVIVNCVAPGFCRSGLTREIDGSLPVRMLLRLVTRRPDVGARTLVWGASAGPESHGQYLPDCKITPVGGLMKGEPGIELQQRVWEELKLKLGTIRPGVSSLS